QCLGVWDDHCPARAETLAGSAISRSRGGRVFERGDAINEFGPLSLSGEPVFTSRSRGASVALGTVFASRSSGASGTLGTILPRRSRRSGGQFDGGDAILNVIEAISGQRRVAVLAVLPRLFLVGHNGLLSCQALG